MALDLEMERQLAARAVKNRDEAWDDMNVPYKMKEHYHGREIRRRAADQDHSGRG